MTILPATYIGSPRHMHEYAQDAITYVRLYGRPDLFITFTCNPQWKEVKDVLFPGQSSLDRHDITTRVFKQKLKSLMNLIVISRVFGETRCWMYSVEWQKRGLPHAHILIWLVDKIRPNDIDDVISAEIPEEAADPGLFAGVTKNMIHGPCGRLKPNSPCMIDRKCSKRYPRALIADITGNDGYPLYRRRSTDFNGKSTTLKINGQDVEVDNRWVVPYSPLWSKAFNAHINVEYCNSVKSIKYICKYVTKGRDMAVLGVTGTNTNDELTQYQLGRYPIVVHLAVHLENGQRVYFTTNNAIQRPEISPSTKQVYSRRAEPTHLQERCFTLKCRDITRGINLQKHSNDANKERQLQAIRVSFQQMLNVRGPTSFISVRTVRGEVFATYREACQKIQLLENDMHWEYTLADAVQSSYPHQLRTLFAIVISTCFPSNPINLWEKFKDH
ncbi:uncharacterized protein LOC118736293 [Rhagoletis pomonella]|uniref:uncharacterized protein LOC118736293 n=1 Tax=Rhagoletis pomonella TaxID=28610 RepID=UPI001785DECD|nr:uncharacterized protein LOC118736293 [Rhagoletis pomonella]